MPYTNLIRSPFKVRPSNKRAKLIAELSCHLWDETKPAGQEGVPESQWEGVLTGPCNGDKQLIAEVIASEQFHRARGSDLMQFFVPFDLTDYEAIITPFMRCKDYPVHLLWGGNQIGWYPEENWDQLLSGWCPPYDGAKERLKRLVHNLSEDRTTRTFRFKLPAAGIFGR
jgi:hypothetical protein